MDATSSDALPHGVAATRIPQWVLPSVPPDTLRRLRPDLLIFQGLASTDSRIPPPNSPHATNLRSLQARVTVHIIELTFTSLHDDDALAAKMDQHTLLAHYLRDAGWIVSKADVTHRPAPRTPSPPPAPPPPAPTPAAAPRIRIRRRAPAPLPPPARIYKITGHTDARTGTSKVTFHLRPRLTAASGEGQLPAGGGLWGLVCLLALHLTRITLYPSLASFTYLSLALMVASSALLTPFLLTSSICPLLN